MSQSSKEKQSNKYKGPEAEQGLVCPPGSSKETREFQSEVRREWYEIRLWWTV